MTDDTGAKQVSAGELPPSKPSVSPFSSGFNVTVSIPHSVEIKMVDATTLADYEVWLFIASLMSNAVVGFLIAAVQEPNDQQLRFVIAIFIALFIVATTMALTKRHKLDARARRISLQTMDVREPKDAG